jgi:hypothetical protein
MTANPPPPPDEGPSTERPFDPRRSSIFPPAPRADSDAPGCAGRAALILLGAVSFVIAIGVFVSLLASGQPIIGFGVSLAVLIALFVIRKKSGPSPALGAVLVGVSIAVVLFGGCMLILANTKMDFK